MITIVCPTCGAGIWAQRPEAIQSAIELHDLLCGVE